MEILEPLTVSLFFFSLSLFLSSSLHPFSSSLLFFSLSFLILQFFAFFVTVIYILFLFSSLFLSIFSCCFVLCNKKEVANGVLLYNKRLGKEEPQSKRRAKEEENKRKDRRMYAVTD